MLSLIALMSYLSMLCLAKMLSLDNLPMTSWWEVFVESCVIESRGLGMDGGGSMILEGYGGIGTLFDSTGCFDGIVR